MKPAGVEEVGYSLQADHNDSELWGKQLEQDEQYTQPEEAFTVISSPTPFDQ